MGEPARFLLRASVLTRSLPLFFVICYPRYDSRRQALLAGGVDPADLSVFGAALTQGLSPGKRVTNAAVAVSFLIRTLIFLADHDYAPTQSYKAQFLLARQQQHRESQPQQKEKTSKTLGRTLTREESLLSIADAIRPPGLRLETDMADEPPTVTRRGHSVSSNDHLRTFPSDLSSFLGNQKNKSESRTNPIPR